MFMSRLTSVVVCADLSGRPRAPVAVGLALALVAAAGAVGCQRNQGKGKAAPAATSGEGDSQPVARVDDTVITVGEVRERINKQAPFTRGRYSSLDKRKELLDNLIRVEVMAKEAEKRGYDQDPEVVRVKKQQMISKFLQKEFESKLRVEDVPDADVEKYYKEHPEEFNRPDEVRVSQIVVKDKATADKVAAKAQKAAADAKPTDRADPKAFRELVTKFSEDEDSKPRGGDLTSFDRASTLYPKPIIDAAFALKEVGDISPVVKTDKGFHVLRLTQKRPGFSRPLAEVKRQIQQRLFRDMRTKALDSFVNDLKQKYTVTVDEAALGKLNVDIGMDPRAAGMGGPPPPGPPGMPGMGHPVAPGAMPVPAKAEVKTETPRP